MPEHQSKEPQDKAKKTRSLGSFLLFLTVLIAVLFMVAGDSLVPSRDLTQDQYMHHLLGGRVAAQKFTAENRIEGELADGRPFKVSFTNLSEQESRFQQLKAIAEYRRISADALRSAVEGGWYVPQTVRVVTTYEQREERVAAGRDGRPESAGEEAAGETGETIQGRVDTRPREKTELYVSVLARSQDAWDGASAAATKPFLPTASGTVWFEVTSPADSGALVAYLQERGATKEQFALDLSPNKGSAAVGANTLMHTVLLIYGPWILIIAVFLLFIRQLRSQGGAGGVMSFGRSRAQLYSKENHTNVTFDDVAGNEEAKDEVREVVEFLKNPGRFTRIGGRIPRGILLVGPPGCGKTLLAKAIAGEAEVPFFSISGSDFVEMFVGVGASRVRDLFKQARENNPCIIFLDEIDAVGRRRGSGMGGGHDEREQTLNAILVEMDGFSTDEGIIIIAATNRPDVLDPALLRPGRFDREVTIDLPDIEGREAILATHLRKVRHAKDVDVSTLARSTPGYSGADLAAVINEAAIMAVLAKHDEVRMEHLEEARDKVRYGRQKKSRKIELEDRRITAYHEAGHAVVASVLEETDAPHKVTIVPRGRALGATMTIPEKESYHHQRKRLVGNLAVLFGGRVAEAHFCGDISAGASDDIRRATELARAMVTELGMSERIGPINYAERQGSDFLGTELLSGKWHSEETAREIDEEVQRLLRDAYERAEKVVADHPRQIEQIAEALLKYETITGKEIGRLLAGENLDDLRPTPPPPTPAPEPVPSAREKARGGERRNEGLAGGPAGEPGLSPA